MIGRLIGQLLFFLFFFLRPVHPQRPHCEPHRDIKTGKSAKGQHAGGEILRRLPALLQRFEKVTLGLWKKHGIRQAGFWTTLIGDSSYELTYLLAWESLAEREQKWTGFMSDPQWISARAESERDGPIIQNARNQILQPTAFSAVK